MIRKAYCTSYKTKLRNRYYTDMWSVVSGQCRTFSFDNIVKTGTIVVKLSADDILVKLSADGIPETCYSKATSNACKYL